MSAPVVVSLSGSPFLQIKAGHVGRAMPWGSSWTSIRIIARLSVTHSGEDALGLPYFGMGVASGANQWVGDNPTRHCIFAAINAGFLDYTTTTRTAYLLGATLTYKARKRIVVTDTDSASAIGGAAGYLSADPAYRSFFAVDLVRSGGNINVNCVLPTTNDLYDVPQTWMREVCSTPTFFAPPTGSISAGTARALAVDEGTYGVLDHVFFYWDRASVPLNISDLVIGKMA